MTVPVYNRRRRWGSRERLPRVRRALFLHVRQREEFGEEVATTTRVSQGCGGIVAPLHALTRTASRAKLREQSRALGAGGPAADGKSLVCVGGWGVG